MTNECLIRLATSVPDGEQNVLITASDNSLLPIWLLKFRPKSTMHFVSDRRQCRTIIVQELAAENSIEPDRVHCYESIKDVVKHLFWKA